jgi:hypothetical protein
MVGRAGPAPTHRLLGTGRSNGPGLGRPPRERVAPFGSTGGSTLRRRGALRPTLQAALASPGGKCYRHCDRPIRTRRLSSPLPGTWHVRACPSGVVSVTVYAEWTRTDPTRSVLSSLRRWTVPPSLVRRWDLRIATRHGPELGPAAERMLAAMRPARGVRVVYWRVYPFRARDGTERRLFVCFRPTHQSAVFFASSPTAETWGCPVCARRRATSVKRKIRRTATRA